MKTNIPKQRLKVAVLIRHFNSAGGGAERYCVELTKRLSEIHEVHVFTQHNHETLTGITFHQIPQWFTRPRYLNQLLFSLLTKRATRGKFDIIHSHDTVTHANIYTLHVPCFKTKWTRATGAKKILRWTGTLFSPRKLAYLWLENQEMRSLPERHFISVSEYLSRNILDSYPQLDHKITIAHPGITVLPENEKSRQKLRQQFREAHQIPQSAFVLLFVAHGFKRKGLPAIISALESLNRSDIHLIIAGSGNPNEIEITSPTVKQNTHFIGVIKHMDDLYPVADTLIHPTLGDTYGMVVLEAMSHKLPVIVSGPTYCGFSEHLTHNNEALSLDNPRDVDQIKAQIDQLHTQPKLQKLLSLAGFEKSQGINWEKTLAQTLCAYEHVIK